MILTDVYGCETWSLVSRKEYRSEKTKQLKIFGHMMKQLNGQYCIFHNIELHDLYRSLCIAGLMKL
jgi:hypothetical protein